MKVLVACLVLALCVVNISADPMFENFLGFVKRFNRTYASQDEFMQRYANFQASQALVQQLRAEHQRVTGESGEEVYGITKFSDWSAAEFKSLLGFKPRATVDRAAIPVQKSTLMADPPSTFDWRDKGAVSPVKDQANCGSCWAFSATEEIESMHYLQSQNANAQMLELSVQQIVSCDTTDGGCDGGDTITAYEYVKQAGGLETNSEYPYTSGNGNTGSCKVNNKDRVVTITNYTYATPPCTDSCKNQDEGELVRNMVATGPVSICVYAEPWQVYTGGVLQSGCTSNYADLDHCVQLVGYNQDASTPYWYIRNSWGTDWGYDGYIYVKIGGNVCGVADEATFVSTKDVSQ